MPTARQTPVAHTNPTALEAAAAAVAHTEATARQTPVAHTNATALEAAAAVAHPKVAVVAHPETAALAVVHPKGRGSQEGAYHADQRGKEGRHHQIQQGRPDPGSHPFREEEVP